MAFDKDTRNLLAKTVAACRRRLIEDVTDQLRGVFGLHTDGTVLPLDKLTHLSPDQNSAARRLRDLLDHYTVGAAGKDSDRRMAAYERMVLEISFTVLNRLAALRLCEERGLVIECVRKGTTSAGFQMFERISGGALGGRYDTYRVFLECMFDELALDLGALFDRMTPQSSVFPSERCMEDVLAELNKPELTHLWTEDETIGWIYQYFNPPEERKAMREASQAPRNSRELAVRNQFFTPRYVVEFLTDNTLGRIWFEMRKGDTVLKDECRYLVRRPSEVFLGPGEKAPAEKGDETDLSQEELLKRPVYIEHRPKKDPRDLRVLDPACGSGHFLLYAFNLLERIYEEYWDDPAAVAAASRRCSDKEDVLEDQSQDGCSDKKDVLEDQSRDGCSDKEDVIGDQSRDGCSDKEDVIGDQSRDGSATISFFNPNQSIDDLAGNLPHWRQEGVTYFVTFRLSDSLPQSKLKQWREEKESWIAAHPEPLTRDEKKEFYRLFPEQMQTWLDAGHGSCILSRPDLKKLVTDAMLHFNGDRYHLDEYVVMPNHVHVIVTPVAGNELSSILHSWKSFTSHKINKLLSRSGENWQKESFDHIVRSERSLNKFREYIKNHGNSSNSSKSSKSGSGVPPLKETSKTSSKKPPPEELAKISGGTPLPLNHIYPDKSSFIRDIPKLIIENNLHGIDIDPRAVQIAALALWLRAQKTWKKLGLKADARPRIAKSNIVTAEPMPGEEDMRREFTAGLKPRALGQMVDEVFEKMKLAGEAGSLLKIEEEIKDAVAAAGKQWRKQWQEVPKPKQQSLFPTMDAPRPKQQELRFDVEGTDARFWEEAEDRTLYALKEYADRAENGHATRRRLFAEDAARGFAFIDMCRKRYDVVLMNPPFGEPAKGSKTLIEKAYPRTKNDAYAAFVERGLGSLHKGGRLGAITSRTGFFLSTFTKWREEILLKEAKPTVFADLGYGVMDAAMVEAAAYCLEARR